MPLATVISNVTNNTAFIYNGFDELGADNQPPTVVRLGTMDHPAETVLLSQKVPQASSFFVDILFHPIDDLLQLLNPTAFNGGSHYLFADGSVRFVAVTDYSNSLWLIDKTITLPILNFPLLKLPPLGLP